mmetsp:Transcript_6088/g.20660  ORF Transcript_6088/g.20660 Transcript_6088/m.20660 type:complete len:214 (+) Transcript_6088:22-663(+)
MRWLMCITCVRCVLLTLLFRPARGVGGFFGVLHGFERARRVGDFTSAREDVRDVGVRQRAHGVEFWFRRERRAHENFHGDFSRFALLLRTRGDLHAVFQRVGRRDGRAHRKRVFDVVLLEWRADDAVDERYAFGIGFEAFFNAHCHVGCSTALVVIIVGDDVFSVFGCFGFSARSFLGVALLKRCRRGRRRRWRFRFRDVSVNRSLTIRRRLG